jgi:hypothetical protein
MNNLSEERSAAILISINDIVFDFFKIIHKEGTTGTSIISNKTNLEIYPNPAGTKIWIKITDVESTYQNVSLFNLHGKGIVHKNLKNLNGYASIDISAIPEGVHIIKIETPEGKHTDKVITE